jgi:hypothetical protein
MNCLGGYTGFLGAFKDFLGRYMGFFGGSIDFLVGYGYNNISYKNKRNTILIVMKNGTRNNILQLIQRCKLAKGVGQRAAY